MAVERYQRNDGSWVFLAVYYGPDGCKRREKFLVVPAGANQTSLKRAAEKTKVRASELRASVENGTYQTPEARGLKRLSFAELAERFLTTYRTRAGRIEHYQMMLKRPVAALGMKPAGTINRADIERFRDSLAADIGPSSVRKTIRAIGTLYRWGKLRGLVASNPIEGVILPPEPPSRTPVLSAEQEAGLLAELAPWARRIVLFALHSGADRGDILRLTWDCIDENAGTIYCPRGKTSSERWIVINSTIRGVLAEARRLRGIDGSSKIFLDHAGKPPTPNQVNLHLQRAYRRAGIEPVSVFKRLRHSFGSRLAEAGGNEYEIADALGHRSTAMSRVYVKVSGARRRALVERLDPPSEEKRPVSGPEDSEASVTASGE